MKKLLVMLLSLALLLALAACGEETPAPAREDEPGAADPAPDAAPEEKPGEGAPAALLEPVEVPMLEEPLLSAEARVPGDWYALHQGAILLLHIAEDGAYTLSFPGADLEESRGTWTVESNQLFLDGGETEPLLVLDESLLWESAGMRFTREMPQTYVPAEEFYDLQPGGLDGLWSCRFLGVGGLTVSAETMSDDTLLYIEGENVALAGSFFGNVPLVFAYEKDAATASLGEGDAAVTLTLRLQQDGFLRLTLETGDPADSVVFYLSPEAPANAELPEG
jgi:predicted small lipoprotein YifL